MEKKTCPFCSEEIDRDSNFCPFCGHSLSKQNEIVISEPKRVSNDDVVRCPKCGSKQVEFVTYQSSSNFDAKDACCGWMLCGPIGLLFGQKKKTPAKTVRKCKNCGHEF